ncbi:DNA methyltransferase [Fuchsiella alkaliacetigena]|uniref:DNA methyltransferase n=1 Tax=Fuchsiella alkaliacetigena TaxID=957042 RepID=UPI00200A8F89|nr:DNA methyltransferase [Fuchsiella alkaliacetigena]MCK8825798.1 hypothetical protein [Fuchsiella alkaliacetigena]
MVKGNELVNRLKGLLTITDKQQLDNQIKDLKEQINNTELQKLDLEMEERYFVNELEQILAAKSIKRMKYYLERLIKALTEVRTNSINDINLNRWKEYKDILTDSLWLLEKRDSSGKHQGWYHGNFIPQIPNQLLRRYTKQGEWVLDTFLGSGTTLIESQRLGRNGIGVELQSEVAAKAKELIAQESNSQEVQSEVWVGDSTELDFEQRLTELGIDAVQLLIMHPPYWDIISFSERKEDLSNAQNQKDFLTKLGEVVDNTYDILESGRYLVLIIGDKYAGSEWIPLGFYSMQEVMKRGYILKSIVVKNFEDTQAKRQRKNLWRYRALVGGFYIFKHEYIFIFQKE